ncbi:hypothetical protein V2A60_000963 [Cordyceps javanica]
MPNTGRPSQDCHLCRQRRVKCDLARPACQRCAKYGAVCPGYRDQQALVFRNADPSTLQRRRKRKAGEGAVASAITAASRDHNSSSSSSLSLSAPAVAASEDNETNEVPVTSSGMVPAARGPEDGGGSSSSSGGGGGAMVLGRHVTEHWTAQSVPLLLDVYSTLDFLRDVYATGSRGGPLLWSAHIFTRTYIMNVRYPTHVADGLRGQTQRELAMYMGKTLRAVNRALGAPGDAARDDILATVWVLANYEVLAGTIGRQQPVNTWQLHARGLYAILQARGAAPLRTSAGRAAFWPAFNIVQLQALIVNAACPAETDAWLAVCERHHHRPEGGGGEALTLRIAQYVASVCAVQSRVMRHLRAADFRGASADYLPLRQALLDADAAFAEHDDDARTYISDEDVNNEDGGGDRRRAAEMTMDVYMHNVRRAAVIKSHHQMQMLCNLLTHHAPCPVPLATLLAHRRQALHRVNESAQAVVDSLPAAMAPLARATVLRSPQVLFDAMRLVFPLFLVAHVPSTRQEHKDVALRALAFIGREVGIRQALVGGGSGDDDGPTVPLPREARAPLATDDDDLLADPPWVSPPPRDYSLLGF